MSRPVGRCIGCFHDFAMGPCGGCGAVDHPANTSAPTSLTKVQADHPYTNPGNGKVQCETCGKWVWLVTHSCKGIRVAPAQADRDAVDEALRADVRAVLPFVNLEFLPKYAMDAYSRLRNTTTAKGETP